MGNIPLNQKKEFPWECKESNAQIPHHLLWVILSSVSSGLAWEHNQQQPGILVHTINIMLSLAMDVKPIMGFRIGLLNNFRIKIRVNTLSAVNSDHM